MDLYGSSHLMAVAKKIALMANQALPRKGQVRNERDDYIVSAFLINELKTAIAETETLTQGLSKGD